MANLDAAFGLRPVTGGTAGTTVSIHEYTAASSVTFYQGQPVALVSGVINVLNSTNWNNAVGVAMNPVASAATDRSIWISDDPTQEYEVQLDSDTTLVTTDAGLRGVLFAGVSVSSGTEATNQSIAELDSSSGTSVNNSTVLSTFMGLRFSQEIENVQTTSWGKVVVKINPENHVYAQVTRPVL